MKDIRVVIFDFDGTLADVVPLMREIYGEFAAKNGYPELTEKTFQDLRKSSLREVIKWVGVRPWQLPGLMRKGRALFAEKSDQVRLFKGIPKLVSELHQNGWEIYILSSNSPATIHDILSRNNIDDCVSILKRPSLFGKGQSIKTLARKKRYDKKRIWMVGDEVRDVEGANKAGVNSIAVTWGLQHEVVLKKAGPTHVAKTAAQLKKLLTQGDK